MANRELSRQIEIQSRIQMLMSRSKEVKATYARISLEKAVLDQELKRLHQEFDDLSQGQLMFRVA